MADDPERLTTPGQLLDKGIVAFETIPHPMRSWAIVGCYMGYFALLENTLARRLGLVLAADALATAIIGRNMGVIEKVRALRTLTNFAVRQADDKVWLDGLLKRAQRAAEQRNIVAHTPYGASRKSNGIEFYAVEASGKFRQPDVDWSVAEANAHVDELRAIADELASPRAVAAYKNARDVLREPKPDLTWLMELLGVEALND